MPNYLVRWEIDIEADTPREAAVKALEIQRDTESIATVFHVFVTDEIAGAHIDRIDLGADEGADVWRCQESACRWQGSVEDVTEDGKCPTCGGLAYLAITADITAEEQG